MARPEACKESSGYEKVRRTSARLCKPNLRIKDFLINQGREWNHSVLERLFATEERRKIELIRPCRNGSKDVLVWDFNNTWHYSVKSGYWVQFNIINKSNSREELTQPSLDSLYQLA